MLYVTAKSKVKHSFHILIKPNKEKKKKMQCVTIIRSLQFLINLMLPPTHSESEIETK